MHITLNGELREIAAGATISALLLSLNLPSTRVAVEVNGDLVRRLQHETHVLLAADMVEIVTLVGGG